MIICDLNLWIYLSVVTVCGTDLYSNIIVAIANLVKVYYFSMKVVGGSLKS